MKIFHRWDGSKVLFENDSTTMRETVLAAIADNADLRSANLRSADLTSANLRSADLTSADLRYANLRSADLRSADLRSADLRSADLRSADLTSADLTSANLTSANLRYANLRSANLTYAKQDVWDVLLRAPGEIAGLLAALREGRVNGSAYEGDCACLVGTIANVACKGYADLELIKPNSSRPAERWFLAIRKGDTPETSSVSKITVEWVEEFEQLLTRAIAIRSIAPVDAKGGR
jgi:Pentapeptide repeats (8 copies)